MDVRSLKFGITYRLPFFRHWVQRTRTISSKRLLHLGHVFSIRDHLTMHQQQKQWFFRHLSRVALSKGLIGYIQIIQWEQSVSSILGSGLTLTSTKFSTTGTVLNSEVSAWNASNYCLISFATFVVTITEMKISQSSS